MFSKARKYIENEVLLFQGWYYFISFVSLPTSLSSMNPARYLQSFHHQRGLRSSLPVLSFFIDHTHGYHDRVEIGLRKGEQELGTKVVIVWLHRLLKRANWRGLIGLETKMKYVEKTWSSWLEIASKTTNVNIEKNTINFRKEEFGHVIILQNFDYQNYKDIILVL